MPVFTGAALAVMGAAATIGTATATAGAIAMSVATAAVAVSAAVGVAGLAVTAVGMITKDKGLMKAGKIMGYVGLAGAAAGGLVGGLSTFMTGGADTFLSGVSGAFTGAAGKTGEAMDMWGGIFSPDAGAAVNAPLGGQIDPTTAVGATPTNPNFTPSGTPGVGEFPSTSIAPGSDTAIMQQKVGGFDSLVQTPPVASAPAPTVGTTPVVATPQTPTVATPGMAQTPTTGFTLPTETQALTPAAIKAKSMLDGMPDWMKMSMMTTAGQGLSGMLSGYMAGTSAEEQLEFQKLVNAQRQGQVDLMNQRTSYAPLVSFKPKTGPAGMVQR